MKIVNKILFYAKTILMLISFSLTMYISLMKMDFMSSNILAIIPFFIPFLILLVLSVISIVFNKDNDNILFNFVCILSFLAIIIISLRTLFDKNIIQYGTSINYNFFINQEIRMKLLLYLIIGCNGCLILKKKNVIVIK